MLINDRYLRLRDIAKTEMSEIFFVEDKRSDAGIRWLAKKVRLTSGDGVSAGLTAERDILLKTRHHALPRIYDTFVEDGSLYIIRDYIQGETLAEVVEQYGILPENTVREYCRQLCDVFAKELHRVDNRVNSDFYKPYPIIYQDLKPSNIIIDGAEHLYLIDFGIARSDPDSRLRGSTRYFGAPEQTDPAAVPNETMDIYGFGATIYYLLTGVTPGYPPVPVEQANMWAHISEGMQYIVMKCLRQNPGERYQSFGELQVDLDAIDSFSEYYRKWAAYYRYDYNKQIRRRRVKILLSFVMSVFFSFVFAFGLNQVYLEYGERFASWAEEQAAVADACIRLMDYTGARNVSAEVLDKRPDDSLAARFWYISGVAYFYQNDFPTAAEYFELASQAQPENSLYRRDLAVCLVKLERADDALAQLELLPAGDLNGIYVQAQIYELTGDYTSAMRCYESCFAADDELRANAYISAARLAYEMNLEYGMDAAMDAQIIILEKAESNPLTNGRTMILDALLTLYFKKAESAATTEEQKRYYDLSLEKSYQYITLVGGSLKIYTNIAQIYRKMDMLDESRYILDEALYVLGDFHELYYQYALTEGTDVAKKPKSERDYEPFLYYAKQALLLAPHENAATGVLREFVEYHGLKWSDAIWQ